MVKCKRIQIRRSNGEITSSVLFIASKMGDPIYINV